MSDPGQPAGPPQFITSVLPGQVPVGLPVPPKPQRRNRGRPPGPAKPRPELHPAVAAHGYVEPQPPPGTDPRFWCATHHCLMRVTLPPQRRILCPRCLPGASFRHNRPLGLRCARVGCASPALFDLWGVPVCSPSCVGKIGAGCPVRPRGVALRVIAYEAGGSWVVLACFRNPTKTGDESMIRIYWWSPASPFARVTRLRRPRLAKRYQSGRKLDLEDETIAYFLVRLARAQAAHARAVIPDLQKWRAEKGPRPWVDTTLAGVLARAAAARAEQQARRADARRTRRSEYFLRPRRVASASGDTSESPLLLPAPRPASLP